MPRRSARPPHSPAPGIRLHGAGWQITVKVRGVRDYEHHPRATPIGELLDAKRQLRARMELRISTRPSTGTFAADAAHYLQRPDIRALTTYNERVQHLEEWCAVVGTLRRRKITPDLIAAQRDRWMASRGLDAKGQPLPPYSASAINHRLRALSNVWTKLDGRHAPNPAREVAEVEEPDAEARGLSYEAIEAILAAIPDHYVGKRADGTLTAGKPRQSRTKARLRVMAYTGLSHAQLMRLEPSDVDLQAGTMRLIARRKGRKIQRARDKPLPQLIPLIPPAVEAFRAFAALNCWGHFSHGSMWRDFQRACRLLGLVGLRPYDFRHSFLSAVYGETKDLRATGRFGGHRNERTTLRYALAAVNAHVAEAAEKVRAKLAPGLASTVPQSHGNTRTNVDASGDAKRRTRIEDTGESVENPEKNAMGGEGVEPPTVGV